MKNEKPPKLPALQFYPGDWRKDPGIQALSRFDRSVWFDILLLMHESEERGVLLLNGKPMPETALANALGLDNQLLNQSLTNILEYGVASKREDGAIFNRRMVRDQEIRSERIKAGQKGGNPNLIKQKLTTQLKQSLTPSSSSSSSISSSSSEDIKRSPTLILDNLIDNQKPNPGLNGHNGKPKKPKDPPGYRPGTKAMGPCKHVYLTQEEYDILCKDFTKDRVHRKIISLDADIENGVPKYVKYSNHKACLLKWFAMDGEN